MLRYLLTAVLLIAARPAQAQQDHTHAAVEGHLGTVAFANSCTQAAQADLLRGVAMLHSFWYSAGEVSFRAALATDPACAIAEWGIASLMMDNALNGAGSNPVEAVKGQAALAQARSIGASTQRERDYIEAVGAYYRDFATRPERDRQATRASAYEALAAKYPDDDEARIFSALYIAATQSQSDQTYAAYARATDILEPLFRKYPDHPGIAHYMIHAYDAPPLAARGLAAARAYSAIAPDAPHAQHMPSHIFTRVGAWTESIASNERAFTSALAGGEFSESQHAADYLVYADLQLARDEAAAAAARAAMAVAIPAPVPAVTVYARAAMPARLLLERGDWQGAAQLPDVATGQLFGADALTLFARAIGAARSGDADAASRNAEQLGTVQKALAAAGNTYWASEVGIQAAAATAWAAYARGDKDAALAGMRDAADREDRQEKHIVTPGRILPARELLGDMLMDAGQPMGALVAYEASLVREPNRFRGVYGAARAAEEMGDRAKAAIYAQKLLDLTKGSVTARPELVWARDLAG